MVGSSSSTGFPPRDLLHPRHRPPPFRTRPLARAGRTAVDRAVSLRRRLNPERSFSVHVMSRPCQSRLSCQFLSTCLCLYGTGTSSVCLSTLFCVFFQSFFVLFFVLFFSFAVLSPCVLSDQAISPDPGQIGAARFTFSLVRCLSLTQYFGSRFSSGVFWIRIRNTDPDPGS